MRVLSSVLEFNSKEERLKEQITAVKTKQSQIYLMSLGIAALVFALIVIILLFSRRMLRSKLNLERMNADNARRMLDLEENDKTRVADEIHHIAGPILLALNSQIEDLETREDPYNSEISQNLVNLSNRLRSLSHRMSPSLNKRISFLELINALIEDLKALSSVEIADDLPSEEPDLPKEKSRHCYRIIQELLINGIKYVKSGKIEISISVEEGQFLVFYKDNGPGFNIELEREKGLGIASILERAKFMGGNAEVKTHPGNGVKWIIHIPLQESKNG